MRGSIMKSNDNKSGYNVNIESELTNLPFPDDFHLEEHLISTMITPPTIPDGGYGWFIVMATFTMNFVCDGIIGSVSIILPEIQRYYDSSIQDTAMILSMLILFTYISSPLAAILMDRFKPRTLVIFFGLLGTLSVSLSYFATSVKVMAFSFGVLPGLSFSICVMSAQVMISLYFDTKRVLAYSITGVGSGVGSILMPILTSLIIENHGFKTLFFFWGGVIFLLVVVGPLYFPLKLTDEQGKDLITIAQEIVTNADNDESAIYMRDLTKLSIDYAGSVDGDTHPYSKNNSNPALYCDEPLLEKPKLKAHFAEKTKKLRENLSFMSNLNRNTTFTVKPNVLRQASTSKELSEIYNVLNSRMQYVPNSKAKNLNRLKSNETSFYNQVVNCYTGNATFSGLLCRINQVIEQTKSRKKNIKIYSHSEGDFFRLKYGEQNIITPENPFIDKKTFTFLKKWIEDLMLKPMNRADIFYKGSRKQMFDQGLIEEEPEIRNIIHVPKMDAEKGFFGNFSHILSIIIDLSIFRIPQLVVYFFAVGFFSFGTYVPLVYIVLFAARFSESARYLPSVIGGGSVIGQLFCGVTASYFGATPRRLSEAAFYISAISTATIASLDGHFYPLAVVCFFFGFTYGVLLTTWQSILSEIVGIRRLTASLSFYLFFRGLSVFVGLYSSSVLIQSIGIKNTIYMASALICVSAFVQSSMRFSFFTLKSQEIDRTPPI